MSRAACTIDWLGTKLAMAVVPSGLKSTALRWLPRVRSFASAAPVSPRPRLVVLGTGWAGARLARDVDCERAYQLTVVSPRNHMVFTPLLASCAVGTLEVTSVVEPIRYLQPALKLAANHFFAGTCTRVDMDKRVVVCEAADGHEYDVAFDKLAICTGALGTTFGVPGVEAHTFPLRDATNALRIRERLLTNIGLAAVPGRSEADRRKLLNTVIVGGGPTGVEFAGELASFVRETLGNAHPGAAKDMRVTLVEANELLGSFDASLRTYAASRLEQSGVEIVKGAVSRVDDGLVELKDGTSIPTGLVVWSTGVGPTPFTSSLPFALSKGGRLAVNERLNVFDRATGAACPDVFALGDCAADDANPLPPLAQVAEQQGKFVAKLLNSKSGEGRFEYRHLGSMAALTTGDAVIDLGKNKKGGSLLTMKGIMSFIAWRSAYLTRLGTWRSRAHVAMDWMTAMFLGRDISRVSSTGGG